jgi:alkanesulfonate monooxygenase SsuD/methylene tetrahydromethanopterin reductase-like flavin-dependent oxidoreductase (luciferase family)
MKTRLGAFLLRPPGAREAVRRFRFAEELGFGAAFATHVNGQEALTMLGAAAVSTERIQIGVGVVPIYTRTPTTMAQSAATLAELSGGRAMLGLGSGHRLVMQRWHGDSMDKPIADMREYVAIMRAVLSGSPLPSASKWASDMPLVGVGAAPDFPLHIGGLSPAMCRLAGEIADGVMVWLGTPRYIAEVVVPAVREGRERVGKSMEGFDVVASIPCAVTDDEDLLKQTYVKQIAHNLRLPFYRNILERGGYHAELGVLAEVDRYEDLERPMPGEVLVELGAGSLVADIAAIGDARAVATKLEEYRDCGVTTLGINPVRIDDYDRTLEAVARSFGLPS